MSEPSSQPTAYQTSRFIYSRKPSAVPTRSPTLSEAAAWVNKLQESLGQVTVNDTSAVVHRSTYYEMDVVSNSPSQMYGSCSLWQSTLSGDVYPSKYIYNAKSISIRSVVDYNSYDRYEDFSESQVVCSDPTATSAIVSALVGAPQLINGASVARSITCGSKVWVVRHCPVSSGGAFSATTYSPAVCVGCTDPCSPTLHCNAALSTPLVKNKVVAVAPCVSQQCPGTSPAAALSPATALRVLSVSYADIEQAPTIVSMRTVISKNSIRTTVQLSAPGTLYCAVRRYVEALPTSLNTIIMQNNVATTGADNTTVVTISGLDVATDYRLYFLTVSSLGVRTSLDQVLASAMIITTECCKTVSVALSAASVIENRFVSKHLSIMLNSAPSTYLRAQVLLYAVTAATGESELMTGVATVPAVFDVSYASSMSPLFASLPALPAGLYEYRVVLSADAAAEYTVQFANSVQRFEVVSADAEPPVPRLTQAVFGNDGSFLTVRFSAGTNKGNLATSFSCSQLLTFDCASTSRCQWMDAATVRVIIASGGANAATCAKPGTNLSLLSTATVKAQCQATNGVCLNYSSWQTAAAASVVIQAPEAPVAPVVSISAPSVIGSCDDLSLDVTGSTGSGGRNWASSTIAALSTPSNNIAALSSALSAITALTPPPIVTSSLMAKGFNYNFVVTLCNFLGQCSTGSKQVLVLNSTMPSVTLQGPSLRTITRKDALSLTSTAFVSTCGGGRTTAGLTYRWTISSNDVQLLSTTSVSRDPSKFLLPANALSVNTFYKVLLSVSAAGSAQTSEVSTQVFVKAGSLVGVVSGGSARTMRVSDTLLLDGASSYDEDQLGVLGAAAGLKYFWACTQTSPVLTGGCSSVFDNAKLSQTAGSAVLTLAPLSTAAGAVVQVTLMVTDDYATRAAETVSIAVTVLPDLSPVVSVTAPGLATAAPFNADQVLQLKGQISVPAGMGGNATWQIDDASIDLASIALFPLTVRIPASLTASSADFTSAVTYMAITANSLPAGSTLTFSLLGAIPYRGQRALASVTVTVNAPPTSGSFTVSPPEGVELTQVFEFVAIQWVDPDLPLSYTFGYTPSSGGTGSVILRSRLELSYGTSLLPAGDADSDFQVTCNVQVFDSLNANTSSSDATKVTKSAFNSTQVDWFVRDRLAAAGSDADSIRQAAALSAYLLNSVNCSLAPNCSALHRQNCHGTAHTCGSCVSNAYIGEGGDSNEPCIDLNSERRSLTASISTEIKSCPGNCSGHGTCVHIRKDSGALVTLEMPSCGIGALDCLAVCDCDDAYYGSDSCDTPTEDFQQKQANRDRVIGGVQSLVRLEDPDVSVVAGWASSVSLAAQVSSELTAEAGVTVLSLVDAITASAKTASSNGVSASTAKSMLSAVNAVMDASTKTNRRRRLQHMRRGLSSATSDVSGVQVDSVQSVLNNFGALVSQGLLPSQAASQFTQSEFRMSVQVLPDSSVGGATESALVTAIVPQTALEKHLGYPTAQASVPSSQGGSLVVTSVRSALFETASSDPLQSNSLMIYSPTDLCTGTSCKAEIVLHNSELIGYSALNNAFANETFNATCLKQDFSTHNFTCQNGETVSLSCEGVAAVVTRQCPVIHYAAACSALRDGVSGCSVRSYTDTGVTCECDLYYHRFTSSGASRRLRSDGANVTTPEGYSVSYAAILQSTADTFVSTVLTADNLNADTVMKGWRALATLGALAIGIIVSLVWSNHADHQMKKVSPKGEDKVAAPTPSVESLAVLKGREATSKKRNNRKVRFGARAKKIVMNTELAIVEDSLPRALSSRTFSDRFLEEVKQHHRWFGIVFYFSDSFPRVLRVMSLATNAIVLLFIQSITYNLTNPDDGSCATFDTEVSCLEPKSSFATGESMCGWVYSGNNAADGSCVYIEPDGSIRIVLFVAIFCAIVTTPIAMSADWVILHILSAPTQEEALATETAQVGPAADILGTSSPSLQDAGATGDNSTTTAVVAAPAAARPGMVQRTSSASNLMSYFGMLKSEAKVKEDKLILAASKAELLMLSMKLKKYRDGLRADELEEFNSKFIHIYC